MLLIKSGTAQLEFSSLAVRSPRRNEAKEILFEDWNMKYQWCFISLIEIKLLFLYVLAKLPAWYALLICKLYRKETCLPVKHSVNPTTFGSCFSFLWCCDLMWWALFSMCNRKQKLTDKRTNRARWKFLIVWDLQMIENVACTQVCVHTHFLNHQYAWYEIVACVWKR